MMQCFLLQFFRVFLSVIALSLLTAPPSFAQRDDIDLDLDEVEDFLDREDDFVEKKKKKRRRRNKKKINEGELQTLSDLAGLKTFSRVAVIQPRFLRKTGKFELFGGATVLMNEAFFNTMGGAVKLGYYFSEKWGVEGTGFFLSSSEKQVTTSLGERNIITESLVTPKNYMGLDLKWVPIYGKMSFFNSRIVPFDFYFTVGGGLTGIAQTESSSSASTIKVGTGQMFAIRNWLTFRWDFSWHFFSPTVDSTNASNSSGTSNNLFVLLGVSMFLGDGS